MNRFLMGAALLPSLAGCMHVPYSRGGFDQSQKIRAVESWRYAQLAYNVYHREFPDPGTPASPAFVLDPDFVPVPHESNDNDDVGLAYDLYRLRSAPDRLIAVFRGTEPDGCDFGHGNLRLHQQERATGDLRRYIRERSISPDAVTLVGHSLGGAIATHLSYRLPGSRSYVFNASPVP